MKSLYTIIHNRKAVVRTEDIVICEADGKYSKIITAGEKEWLVSRHLGELESQLPVDAFCRVNRKYIININYLSEIDTKGGCRIKMENEITVTVSSRRKKKVLETIHRFFNS